MACSRFNIALEQSIAHHFRGRRLWSPWVERTGSCHNKCSTPRFRYLGRGRLPRRFDVLGRWNLPIQTSSSQSPATPSPQIVLAHVYWDGDSTAPQIVRQMMGNGSEIHSIHATKDGGAVVSTNEEFYIISKDSVQVLPYASTTMVYESEHDRAWLFGERGSNRCFALTLRVEKQAPKNSAFRFGLSNIRHDCRRFFVHSWL